MRHEIRWTAQKIAGRLALIEPLVYRSRRRLSALRYKTLPGPLDDPPVAPGIDDSAWETIRPNSYWGRWLTDFVLRGSFSLPEGWDASQPTALVLPLGEAGGFSHPEALVYFDGEPYATCDRHHQEILLPGALLDGREHALALHGWTGLGGAMNGEFQTQLFMREPAIVQLDQPTRELAVLTRIALGTANTLEPDDPARSRLLNTLDAAYKILDTRDPIGDAFYASVPTAYRTLKAGIAAAGMPIDVDIVATGHAHIDVAWLWTLGQTRRKAGRTFHNVLRLMEQFPEYHFTQSQPQLYDYLRQDYPALYEGIRERVAEGRWETIGGMWVEADCNISGGESLARQFLLGRTFFREQFGADAESPVLWLPDVFGYAWNLPQLIREAGLEYFMTIKIGWSQYNRLPVDTFWWQGLDGTKVLTHFITTKDKGSPHASTYNAMASPEQVMGTWTNFQQKELHKTLLMAYGYGDGGGGPTREMLENIRELADFPAMPRLRQGSVHDFFTTIEQEAGEDLPTWNGELYLEYHRGTYTTQARNKRANRKSEFLLHDAEFLAATAALLNPRYKFPAETLRKAWELVCLNQFHDIIPGSSIGPVYVESLEQYAQVSQMAETARDDALAVIGGVTGGDLLLVNPTGFARSDLAHYPRDLMPGTWLAGTDGAYIYTQAVEDGTLIEAGTLPPYSITPIAILGGMLQLDDEIPYDEPDTDPLAAEYMLSVTPRLLENDVLRVEINEAGDITRIYDKSAGREVLAEGMVACQFQAFEDRPLDWDAWDIDIFYDDRMWLADPAESVIVAEDGPLRIALEVRRRILNSTYTQRISLAYNSPRLDIETVIDWRERHILLKAAFPVEVFSPAATYEIQWGNVERPTHRNTSWDWARFETCAQKWVDLSEGDYGVSLLNDCKYGHDIHDNVVRISLLRGSALPDPTADLGEHRFTLSLLPHAGGWQESTIPEAYALNNPLLVALNAHSGDADPQKIALLQHDVQNVIIETVKRAEDGNGIIVRMYEAHRSRGTATLHAGFALGGAFRANLLEENQEPIPVDGSHLAFPFKPYEIITLRLVPA